MAPSKTPQREKRLTGSKSDPQLLDKMRRRVLELIDAGKLPAKYALHPLERLKMAAAEQNQPLSSETEPKPKA